MVLVGQLLRFGGVGGLATALHVIFALVMSDLVGLAPLQANFIGFAGATLFSYLGHACFTFACPVRQVDQAVRFLMSGLVSLASSSFLVWLMTSLLRADFAITMLVVGLVVPAFTFVVLRFWVFEPRDTTGTTDWTGVALCGAMALATLALFWDRPINHDTAWYLVATRGWLDGAGLYTHIIEVNPPLNFYYTLPALGLADLFSISDKNGEYLALSLLLFVVLCWSRTIIRDGFDLTPHRATALLVAIALASVVSALGEFGQREHVLVMLTLPWLLGEASRAPATARQEVLRAAVAALGVCLKPHFILIPLAITVLNVTRQKSLRPFLSRANLTFFFVGTTYVGLVAVVHPTYFSDLVPMATEVYGAYKAPMWPVLHQVTAPLMLTGNVALAGLTSPRFTACQATFLVAAGAGLAIYLLQSTGFHYHTIPFKSFAVIACAMVIVLARKGDALLYSTMAAAFGIMLSEAHRGFYKSPVAQDIAETAQSIGDIDSLMVFTTHVSLGPAIALESDATWISRYPANWLVPGALNRLSETDCAEAVGLCARLTGYADRNRRDNIEDIELNAPDLMVFDRRSGYFAAPGFSWLDFMANDPDWERILTGYRQVKVTDRAVYMVAIPE